MEEDKKEPLTRRRSSGRVRKSPERFVAGASGNQVGGDFAKPAKPERKQRPEPTKLELPAEEVIQRRISVRGITGLAE